MRSGWSWRSSHLSTPSASTRSTSPARAPNARRLSACSARSRSVSFVFGEVAPVSNASATAAMRICFMEVGRFTSGGVYLHARHQPCAAGGLDDLGVEAEELANAIGPHHLARRIIDDQRAA